SASGPLRRYQHPELDIVSYFPLTAGKRLSAIDRASASILAAGMHDRERPVFVSTLTVEADAFSRRHPDIEADQARSRILRSVLMKQESEHSISTLPSRLEDLAGG